MKRFEVVFLALGAALFVALLWRFGFASLLDTLLGQGPRFFLILIPTGAAYLLFAHAWWLTLDPGERREVGFGHLFLISLAGFSLNYMTPFIALGGEPFKMLMLSRRVGRLRGVSSVLAYNALHILSHLFIFMATCLIGLEILSPSRPRSLALGAVFVLSAALAAVLLSCHERGVAERVFHLLRRMRILRVTGEKQQEWQDRLQRYEESVRSLYRTRRRDFWTALFTDLCGRAIWTFEIALMFRNLGHMLGAVRAFFIYSIDGMMMVPTFFVPYELGVKEGAFCLALQWLGYDPSLGVYVGVASRVREIIWIAIGLGIMFALGVRGFPSLSRHPGLTKEQE